MVREAEATVDVPNVQGFHTGDLEAYGTVRSAGWRQARQPPSNPTTWEVPESQGRGGGRLLAKLGAQPSEESSPEGRP